MNEDYKILWVDDEPALSEIMCELLRGEGFLCEKASNGLEAAAFLLKEKFDVLITDFNMPLMNGADLLLWCRKKNIHQPVIFVTASSERIPLEELVLQDCCTSLINKPFSIDKLMEEIDRALKRNHEYDCHGKMVPLDRGDYISSFPGQHLSGN